MKPVDRDREIIDHILRYCQEIDQAVERFGNDRDIFLSDAVYRNAVSMPVQQIGELAKHLSDGFLAEHTEIPWKQIKGMRTWFAHQYLDMDITVIWDVLHDGIPPLKQFCERYKADDKAPGRLPEESLQAGFGFSRYQC